ncbi:calcium-transporting ATPase PMC1 NDAI_0D03510 [Naumovozyma dairenensis CBS 421]|uniref:Calcium-transporting ATPase n=1 Tax=Naumovozyma dairenensis (strain ATCC 10597 / BCRC 20456 / CBS 421 / NBRC 0211 / NRRL Y-12639) TaxID=1071378 RepID=G0WA54_NAUDC|nr:hypothetical protein NDAI_0D03510 [Naumovozyma dairenensis CBS 421]CCD24665.1 hypothetical protein NDAI_0D03510 [Naumovozyma dairenensis CBS 421]
MSSRNYLTVPGQDSQDADSDEQASAQDYLLDNDSLSQEREQEQEAEAQDTEDEYPLTTKQLSELHDPKSMRSYISLFQNDKLNIFKYLNTSLQTGIKTPTRNNSNIKWNYSNTKRYKLYSDNRIPERIPKTFLQLVWEAFNDKTMLLLTGAAIVSFTLGLYEALGQPPEYDPEGNKIKKVDWIEGVAIMIAVVVVVLVGAVNDYQKELQFAKLNKKKENRKVIVVRNAQEEMVSIHDLLVGDIIKLQTGDVIPADSVLVRGECEIDESSVTGESDTIKKVRLSSALRKFASINETNKKNNNNNNNNGSLHELDIGSVTPEGVHLPDCMLISGSKILSGLGTAVVTAVGVNSIHGRTMMSLKVETEETPLQERLSQLADSISVYGCVAAIILFLVLFVRFLFYVFAPNGRFHDLDPAQKGNKFMNIFITAVTIIVVAVPEGLPLAVTLALAFATTRMTKDGNLVRNLRACETMGSATAVCSDKTGTLTENRMSIVKGFIGEDQFDETMNNRENLPHSKDMFNEKCTEDLQKDLLSNIVLNSTAFENNKYVHPDIERESGISLDSINESNNQQTSSPSKWNILSWFRSGHCKKANNDKDDDDDDDLMKHAMEGRQEPYIGSKTETALLAMAKRSLNLKFGSLQDLRDDPEERFGVDEIIQVIPFESSRKWGGIVVKYKASGLIRFFIKGAAEIVSNCCHSKRNSDDCLILIDEKVSDVINKNIKSLASNALRAISLGHRDFKDCSEWPPKEVQDDENSNRANPEKLLSLKVNNKNSDDGLILDGIVGIQDPLREGVKNSVQQCQKAGVIVRMVTGDNVLTARAIARNCNILSEEAYNDPDSAMEGPKFRKLTKDERIKLLPKLRVLARSSPEDKRVLVETLKGMGEVVAVTGDGTNDAPALKLADVGFSMGISGTEVAREASDIILMTDDFGAIVDAIKWGRCVSISIKKFIQFQLIVNITAVILTFVSAVASEDETSVLTAVQLLWVNLIMDTLAALALATDKPDPNIMDRKPKGRSSPLIYPSTWKMILSQSFLQLIITFTLHFHGKEIFFKGKESITGHEQQQLNAMTFNTFVWLQFFTLFVSRKLDEGDGIKNWRKRISKANLNFFQDLLRNYYFLVIMALIGGCQVLIMFFGGAPFSIAHQTKEMWATAILCGTLSIPIGLIVRICPDELAKKFFPTKLFSKCKYIFGLEFLRERTKSSDEEALLDRDGSPNSSGSSAFF